jgi:hypothetical protein
VQLQKTKRLFQQYHYKIWLVSVEPLCEVLADVSYLLLMKSWLSTIVTWLFIFGIMIGKGPAASAARAVGPGCLRRLGCAAVTDPLAAH